MLNLTKFEGKLHPEQQDDYLWIFVSDEKAYNHICDHFLTSPECIVWQRILKVHYPYLYRQLPEIDCYDLKQRENLALEMIRSESLRQRIYNVFAEVIKKELLSAKYFGWIVKDTSEKFEDSNSYIALSLSGIKVVFSKRGIRTAMIPKEKPKNINVDTENMTFKQREKNPLPRENERISRKNLSQQALKEQKKNKGMRKNRNIILNKNNVDFEDAIIFESFRKTARTVKRALDNAFIKVSKAKKANFTNLIHDFAIWQAHIREWKNNNF